MQQHSDFTQSEYLNEMNKSYLNYHRLFTFTSKMLLGFREKTRKCGERWELKGKEEERGGIERTERRKRVEGKRGKE